MITDKYLNGLRMCHRGIEAVYVRNTDAATFDKEASTSTGEVQMLKAAVDLFETSNAMNISLQIDRSMTVRVMKVDKYIAAFAYETGHPVSKSIVRIGQRYVSEPGFNHHRHRLESVCE